MEYHVIKLTNQQARKGLWVLYTSPPLFKVIAPSEFQPFVIKYSNGIKFANFVSFYCFIVSYWTLLGHICYLPVDVIITL